MPKFTAQNRHPGHIVIADSLNEAVAAIAEVSDIVAFACVTKQVSSGEYGPVPALWLVYEDQTKLDMDRDANGTAEHAHWFAVISST